MILHKRMVHPVPHLLDIICAETGNITQVEILRFKRGLVDCDAGEVADGEAFDGFGFAVDAENNVLGVEFAAYAVVEEWI